MLPPTFSQAIQFCWDVSWSLAFFQKNEKVLCLRKAEEPNPGAQGRREGGYISAASAAGAGARAPDETACIPIPPAAAVNLPQPRIWRRELRTSQTWTLSFAIRCGQMRPGLG